VRYVHGGWSATVDRMAAHARGPGVRIMVAQRAEVPLRGHGPFAATPMVPVRCRLRACPRRSRSSMLMAPGRLDLLA